MSDDISHSPLRMANASNNSGSLFCVPIQRKSLIVGRLLTLHAFLVSAALLVGFYPSACAVPAWT